MLRRRMLQCSISSTNNLGVRRCTTKSANTGKARARPRPALSGRSGRSKGACKSDLWELWRDITVKGTRLCTDAKDCKEVVEALPPMVRGYQQKVLALTSGMHDLVTEWNAEVGVWFGKQINTIQKAGAPIPS